VAGGLHTQRLALLSFVWHALAPMHLCHDCSWHEMLKVASTWPYTLRFTLRFRLFISMIRTEYEMNRNAGESQSLIWCR
jgi:hypothetical protein